MGKDRKMDMADMDINIRVMTLEDYDQVYHLWSGIKGFGIRTIDDSREGVEKFLKRNPTTLSLIHI